VGDTKNVISTSGASPSFAIFGGSDRAYQSVGFGATTDGVYIPGFTDCIKLTTAYGVRGAFNHNWGPYWSTSLFGSAAAVRYDGREFDPTAAKGAYCWSYRLSNTGAKSADFSCNPDYNVFQVGVATRWTPVKNLTFRLDPELHEYRDAGHAVAQAGDRPAFSYTSIKDYVTPEQIADQIIFMCSPRGRTISGQAISICGDTQMLG
jgi:hypothetical protein